MMENNETLKDYTLSSDDTTPVEVFEASFSSGQILVKSMASGVTKTLDIGDKIKLVKDSQIANLTTKDGRITPKHNYMKADVRLARKES